MAYDYAPFPYVAPPGLIAPEPRAPVAIVGAGPIGLAMAIDLAQRGIACVVLDDNNVVSVGSRAICWAKRTLEIMDRLGVGERMLEKGVTWKVGRLFHGADEVYSFDLLPEAGHKYPAFINLQQYYVEQFLVERAQELSAFIDLRFLNRLTSHRDQGDHVVLEIETPDGPYTLEADYLIAADGAGSPTRKRMGLPFEGQTFDEHFLIIDVELPESPFATDDPERWFWFAPPFHNGQSALLHKQPDNIYRIDLQLGPETDPKLEATETKVIPRIKAIIGDMPFRLDWMSVYKFRCAKLDRFVHGRVIFVGDSAHVVSPFGARGGNGGIQDVDNLGWKLAEVLRGGALTLLDSYDEERHHGALENIANSARATNFITPKSEIDTLFRNETLRLAHKQPFARKLINSGRLSAPCSLADMALQSGDHPLVGRSLIDLPMGDGWLVEQAQGGFCLLTADEQAWQVPDAVTRIPLPDTELRHARYGDTGAFLVRPDGHICARLAGPSGLVAALARAKGGAS
ncbi:MAG: FAD-dependent monooxygenase [Pseudomonadota bacterium]